MKKYVYLLFLMINILNGYSKQGATRSNKGISSQRDSISKQMYSVEDVDSLPKFPKNLFQSITYPAIARENQIQGIVFVRCIIDEEGRISNAYVPEGKGIGGGCDQEAIRAVSSSTHIRPAIKNGKPVAVWYTIPITFKLQ